MSPKILAVDDEPGVLDMIAGHFRPRGFEVYTAPDGEEAAGLAARVLPDIIILDLKMRKVDGDRICPVLHEIAPRAKIFLITAYDNEVVAHRIRNLPVDRHFEKPVSILELEKAVREGLPKS